MTGRQTLAGRRQNETFWFNHDGVKYHASVARGADGEIAELFLNGGKAGSSLGVMCRDAAVVLSIALQHGVPAKQLLESLSKLETDDKFAGPLGRALEMALK